jgi:hypothetical protein
MADHDNAASLFATIQALKNLSMSYRSPQPLRLGKPCPQ